MCLNVFDKVSMFILLKYSNLIAFLLVRAFKFRVFTLSCLPSGPACLASLIYTHHQIALLSCLNTTDKTTMLKCRRLKCLERRDLGHVFCMGFWTMALWHWHFVRRSIATNLLWFSIQTLAFQICNHSVADYGTKLNNDQWSWKFKLF